MEIIYCEACEGIMMNAQGKKSAIIIQSRTNPLRCKDCEFVEKQVKDRCYVCEKNFRNTLSHFITYGNMCRNCVSYIGGVSSMRKVETSEQKREIRFQNWLKKNKLKLTYTTDRTGYWKRFEAQEEENRQKQAQKRSETLKNKHL